MNNIPYKKHCKLINNEKFLTDNEVWITGAGIVSPLGEGLKTHLKAIKNEISGLKLYKFFNNIEFNPVMSGIIPNNILNDDINQSSFNRADKILEIAFKESLQSAMLNYPNESEIIIGTTLGNMYGPASYSNKTNYGTLNLKKGFLSDSPAIHCARKFKIKGNKSTISAACASGICAIGYGYKKILWGESKRIIAGGVDSLSPFIIAGFNSLKLISKNICKPFDTFRDGLNPAEGAAVLVLESKNEALRRKVNPIARILGFGEYLEGYHSTRTHPNGLGIENGISKALKYNNIKYTDISHIHLHGTATLHNDISEYNGIKKVFGEKLKDIPVCSTKSMTGHTFGGAGAISSVLSILSLNNNIIPATLNHSLIDNQFKDLNISKSIIHKDIKKILITALGFGGETGVLCIDLP